MECKSIAGPEGIISMRRRTYQGVAQRHTRPSIGFVFGFPSNSMSHVGHVYPILLQQMLLPLQARKDNDPL